MELGMLSEKELEVLDEKIKEYSKQSDVAPSKFLESEMRRFVNRVVIVEKSFNEMFPMRTLEDKYLARLKGDLEEEYKCYFEQKVFVKEIEEIEEIEQRPITFSNFDWKHIFGDSSSEVEHFVIEKGLVEILGNLDFGKTKKILQRREFPTTELYLFLIQNGYLYPTEKGNVVVHPNLLKAYSRIRPNSWDTPFLTRDLGRCPYLNNSYYKPLNEEDSWEYWKDLIALARSPLRERRLYLSKDFMSFKSFNELDTPREEILEYLELGRKLVPQRYIELEPKIEDFQWIKM